MNCDWYRIVLSLMILVFLDLAIVWAGSMNNGMDRKDPAPVTGPGRVLILRHALAPGTGDPEGFRIGDCTTQRNLDDRGRRQAAAMGDWLRSKGVTGARVYSSQWCRCRETAKLMKLGEVTDLPALNSFFQRWEEKDARIQALRRFLAAQTMDDTLIILVTHQVTITALTGVFPASGTGVLVQLDEQGGFDTVAVGGFD